LDKHDPEKEINIDRRSLLETSLPQNVTGLNTLLQELDKILLEKAVEWAKKCYKAFLEKLDGLLARDRGRALSVEHLREVWHQTCLGPVKVKRRQYRDGEGKYQYLLDELMGMGRYRHVTRTVQEQALETATVMPYRRSAEVLRKLTSIDLPHQTIWRLVARTADPYLERAEQELEYFLETGEMPMGNAKQTTRLIVEADGVMLSLQQEKERKAEVKLGIAYEGWTRVGRDRYRTVNKTAYAAIAGGDAFWGGMTLKLLKTYDLAEVKDTIVGGDGACWVKAGASYVNGRFQLDRYHANRALCTALGRDRETKARVWEAIDRGDVETGLRILAEASSKANGKQAKNIAAVYNYLRDNSTGLRDYRLDLGEEGKALRRTGAIEGNVDKLVVRRMKNQGMSWTICGIRRLLCVRFLVHEGKLADYLKTGNIREAPRVPRRRLRHLVNQTLAEDPTDWLQADLPALQGPHQSRPWAQALRSLSEARL
jgi:hypothetical protein